MFPVVACLGFSNANKIKQMQKVDHLKPSTNLSGVPQALTESYYIAYIHLYKRWDNAGLQLGSGPEWMHHFTESPDFAKKYILKTTTHLVN